MRDSMVIYRSFFEAVKELDKETQSDIYNAIFDYGLNRNEVELKGVAKTIFTLIKPKVNKKISKAEANNKQSRSKTEAKDKPMYNVDVNEECISGDVECVLNNENDNVNVIFNKKSLSKIDLNFEDFGFFEPLIKRWLDYKKSQHNEKYKSQDTLNTFVKKLIELSNGQFEIAEKIIDTSIASGYKGIFALKTGNGFNQQKPDKMESYKTEYEKAMQQIRLQNQ
jgi:hypothetical protein